MEIDNISILRLEAGSAEDVKNVVKEIVDKNTQRFVFNELNQDNKRKKIWSILFSHLERQSFSPCHNECLAAVRMLSRDKTDLDKLMTDKWVEILLHHAGLAPQEHNQHLALHNLEPEKYQTMIEALKALCNLVYNSEKVQLVCKQNKSVEEIVMRLRLFKEPDLPHEVKYFDMRMLFIITALCPETRERVKDELHGLTYLMETLDVIMNEATVVGNSTIVLNEDQVTLANEILKILFNLLAKHCTPHFDFEEDAHFLRLEIILKNLLLCKTEPKENLDNLHSHIVNLLTTIPAACHKELITNVTSEDPLRGAEFDGKNMEAVSLLIDFLDKRLTGLSAPQNLKSEQDLISPIITVLIECARSEPILRRYLRMHILPPLRDVKTRPEEGDKLRNKLCRLLTSTVTNVRDLVAELLFVLCKENVTRMIKYTGYGNAAGMFANRGLLAHTRQNSNDFSSNSEDSDTEEYTQYRDRINPVVGCYEPPRPDPMASMTEEQKEYEAVKLVNMMDKLSRDGIVQPCRIGEDGRPQPVDHVLQLQEDLSKQKIYGHNDSADEDNN